MHFAFDEHLDEYLGGDVCRTESRQWQCHTYTRPSTLPVTFFAGAYRFTTLHAELETNTTGHKLTEEENSQYAAASCALHSV